MIIDSRYEVQKELGKGLWATVYKVKDIRTDNIYALKLFQKLDPKSLYEKFSADDMHHITKIRHNNLAHVSDFGNHGNHIYYLSEYLKGKTLMNFKFIKANIELLYDITVQICYGLNALHSQNIIHKDLQPNNVVHNFKNGKLIVKIMDYGFTKMNIEKKQQRVGKMLPYIAPEIFMGDQAIPQSDFYSLGVILYKITTGTLPYTAEQIMGFIAGDTMNLIPKFPKELNPDIPEGMEKLILKLLERNTEDRFIDSEDIIAFINQIQSKKYRFSQQWSIIHSIRFSDYIVRENYAYQLLDYIPIISERNGKLVIITAGKGLGKNNILSLFRYHLLTDEYYIFDYECSLIQKDPFFALIKEFYESTDTKEFVEPELKIVSKKLDEYLFRSEQSATEMDENESELNNDFKTVSSFIFHLSEKKPLIFIIRAAQFLTKDATHFINTISKDILDRRILIIISLNDPSKLDTLVHPVHIKIEALDFKKTREYIIRLLNITPPDKFIKELWDLSNGNPLFIEQILIDLTKKEMIWDGEKFNFELDFDQYKIPDDVNHAIYERMSHLSETHYKQYQLLAAVYTPLSQNIIRFLLDISEKELFFLIRDGINNELIEKREEYYYFTFQASQERFRDEISKDEKITISKKVLEYFNGITITMIPILKGIIKHTELCKNYEKTREYKIRLSAIYSNKGFYEKAFIEMCDVIELDFSEKLEIQEKDLRNDLNVFINKSEWTTSDKIPTSIKKNIVNMPDISEKHLITGIFYFMLEKYQLAQGRLKKALNKAFTGRQRVNALLHLGKVYLFQHKINDLKDCIEELDILQLPDELKISYIELKALYWSFTHRLTDALNLVEDYLSTIKSKNDVNFFLKLGSLHNNLAYLYHEQKLFDEADKNYHIARRIWEKTNYKRKLVTVYNNIGDIALRRGDTKTAFDYFDKSMEICGHIDCKRGKIQGLLSQGQAYNKLGKFNIAENYLNEAYDSALRLENHPFLDAIVDNLAIAKSKIHNFAYYYDFIKNNVPDLVNGNIYKITPLTKTYFYYLYHLGDYDKIENLLEKSGHIFLEKKENEFYHQFLGAILLHKQDLKNAKMNTEMAFKYSQHSESAYAKAINYIRLTEYYLKIGDSESAINLCRQSDQLCEENNFFYWEKVQRIRKMQVQLLNPEISLRIIIRELLSVLNYVQEHDLFLLEIEVYELLIQIYNEFDEVDRAKLYFGRYKEKIKNAIDGLSDNDKKIYLKNSYYYLKDHKNLHTVKIASREDKMKTKWEEELYDLLKLEEIDRIKFFIDKTIKNLITPNFYVVALADEIRFNTKPFLSFGIEEDKIFSTKHLNYINKCIKKNETIKNRIDGNNAVFIPLCIKTASVGCLFIADRGELRFQKNELNILQNLRFHLTSILLRINEFSELNKKMALMSKLVEITQKFFLVQDINKLEQEIVAFILDFTGASRGFLIKKDIAENYVYKVAMDDSMHLLKSYSNISKSVLGEVQKTQLPVHVKDAMKEHVFDGYVNVRDKELSIYCAPIIIDGVEYGFLYLDNYLIPEKKLVINTEFMRLLYIQISVSIRNAQQYEILTSRNKEINSLQKLKSEFINIVSHEMMTPLVTLQGYIKRIPSKKLDESDNEIVSKMDGSIERLFSIMKDMINYSKYEILNSIEKELFDIKDILEVVTEKTRLDSKDRKMQIHLEIDEDLVMIPLNWEAIQLMITNIVHNSIRFTKDFGTITIGARHSTFQQEEVDGEETIVIFVQDNGIGIPSYELENVFRKFYELSDIYSHSSGFLEYRSSGMGLGLSTAKLIAKLHNGKIWIQSKENEGTTVFVAIPIEQK